MKITPILPTQKVLGKQYLGQLTYSEAGKRSFLRLSQLILYSMYTICGEGAGGGRGKNGYPVICTHDFLKLSDDHFSLTSNVVSGSELLDPSY